MAHSREARVPFLDHRLVELAFSLPRELKISQGRTKVVLRRALGDLVPGEVLARTDKLGFATPEAAWLAEAGPLVDETLAGAGEAVDRTGARALWSRLREGDRSAAAPLWRVVCFERWQAIAA
jgi:asparagine synthase (glutamine-hydrolysing)